MKISVLFGLFLAVLGAAPASAQTSPTVPSAPVTASPGAVMGTPMVDPDYRLGMADKVRVLVFNEPSLSGEFLVNSNGALSLPLIGDVAATGRTTTEIRAEIERKLAEGFLKEPRVSMDVLNFRPFYILGEVNKPGEYPYSSGLTVMNAVATAQGFTYRADKKKVFVKHVGKDGEEHQKLTSDLLVQPGDTIRIGERYF